MNTTASLTFSKSSIKPPLPAVRYGFALLATGVAFGLTSWLHPFINTIQFDLFLGAVIMSALYAGLGPALLTAALSILLLDYFFIPPLHAFVLGVSDLVRLIVFGLVAVLTSSLSARLKEANESLARSREKELTDISNREQRRLGQDLHDGLCQILAGIRLMTEDLKSRLKARSAPESEDMEQIELRLIEALAQADAVSRGLYPVELDTHGLEPALIELAEKISGIYPVKCRFICPRLIPIPDSAAANHVYRIAQEAVMNAIKSGKAKNIAIRLGRQGSAIVLHVSDDGIGFNPHAARKGMGLKIMSHRARVLNGLLRFRSRKGRTVVRLAFIPGSV